MTGHEKRLLAIGIVSGALMAGAVGGGLFYRFQSKQAPETTTQASPVSEVASPAAAAPVGDMQRAVQLSPEEQAKIGIQTTEVRRESITEDIASHWPGCRTRNRAAHREYTLRWTSRASIRQLHWPTRSEVAILSR